MDDNIYILTELLDSVQQILQQSNFERKILVKAIMHVGLRQGTEFGWGVPLEHLQDLHSDLMVGLDVVGIQEMEDEGTNVIASVQSRRCKRWRHA